MYHIRKIANGVATRHLAFVGTKHADAYAIIEQMYKNFLKDNQPAQLARWSLVANDIVYQIEDDILEAW